MGMLCARGSGFVESDFPVLSHLDWQLQLLPSDQLRSLHGHDPGFDAELTECRFEFLNQRLLNLSFRVDNSSDQPLSQGANALTHHLS